MYLHVFITWLLANLIHPVIMYFFLGNGGSLLGVHFFATYFLILLYSLFISSIGLLLSFGAANYLLKLSIGVVEKFICWLIVAPLLVIANLWLFFIILGEGTLLALTEYRLFVPAMIAVAVTILIRYKYFFKALESLNTESNE
jgi:hypothetical protein